MDDALIANCPHCQADLSEKCMVGLMGGGAFIIAPMRCPVCHEPLIKIKQSSGIIVPDNKGIPQGPITVKR